MMVVETEAEKGPIPTASSREVLMPTLLDTSVPLVSLSPFVYVTSSVISVGCLQINNE